MTAVVRRWRGRDLGEGDAGAASVMVLALVVVLMVVAGLVVDGGRAVNARAAVFDAAEQAARAGANQLDAGALRARGDVAIDPDAASAAAVDHLVAQGYDAGRITVEADTQEVQVTVRSTVRTSLLGLVFIQSFDVEGTATARAAVGILDEIGAP